MSEVEKSAVVGRKSLSSPDLGAAYEYAADDQLDQLDDGESPPRPSTDVDPGNPSCSRLRDYCAGHTSYLSREDLLRTRLSQGSSRLSAQLFRNGTLSPKSSCNGSALVKSPVGSLHLMPGSFSSGGPVRRARSKSQHQQQIFQSSMSWKNRPIIQLMSSQLQTTVKAMCSRQDKESTSFGTQVSDGSMVRGTGQSTDGVIALRALVSSPASKTPVAKVPNPGHRPSKHRWLAGLFLACFSGKAHDGS